jgi:oxepin-CoA hydrolase/3-oxo-5,6-dehydrosuberyl-CoA semialdehyde dehydrogenase
MLVNRYSAKESTGHGSPLPHLVHGGPGRAGGGEEMGGVRGVLHYMQRTALQGAPQTLTGGDARVESKGAERARRSRPSVPEVFRGARDRRDAHHASPHRSPRATS